MLIPSHLQLEPSNSRTRVPAGGIDLIASIDFKSDGATTATLSSSTKVSHGEDTISSAEVATPNHSNQQYSIYAITDAAANIVERYAYTAYGQPTTLDAAASVIEASSISNRYTYTAREWDATIGLYHFRARWMSGLTGRFLSRDPIGYTHGILYMFDIGLIELDPSGNCPGCCCCPASLQSGGVRPITFMPGRTDPGVGHFYQLDSTMNFFKTENGTKSNCSFQFNEYYNPKGQAPPRWFSYPGDAPPDYEKFPPGTTMHDWYKFNEEFAKDSFKCGGQRTIVIPDYPWDSDRTLEKGGKFPVLSFTFFYATLKSGCDYCEDLAWKGCQMMGYVDGQKIQYFGESEAACSKQMLQQESGGYPYDIPDFPPFE